MSAADIGSLYDRDYAERYNSFYLDPWLAKHELNVKLLERILGQTSAPSPAWLDLFCGQAWHFSRFPGCKNRLGIDASPSQLVLARRLNPLARFFEGDVLDVNLGEARFDLVTCFWAAYCYLGTEGRILRFLDRVVHWTRPGGAIYIEVLLPRDVATFNASGFAARTGFRVIPRSPDHSRWCFQDCGGTHEMFSPGLELFSYALSRSFSRVEEAHDGRFMTHVIARDRRGSRPVGEPSRRSPRRPELPGGIANTQPSPH